MSEVRSTIQKKDRKGIIRHGAEWLTLWSDPDSLKSNEERHTERAEGQARSGMEQCLTAAGRSLSGNPQLQFTASAFAREAPANVSAIRGEVDSRALIERFHSPERHHKTAPADPTVRGLFDLCEQLRCEALGVLRFPGTRDNLVERHRQRLKQSDLLNAHLASLIPLAEGLRMTLRDALLNEVEPSIASSGLWMWDRWIRARNPAELALLREAMDDQQSYAALSIAFIQRLLQQVGSSEKGVRRLDPTQPDSASTEDDADPSRLREGQSQEEFKPSGELFLGKEEQSSFLAQPATPPPAHLPYAAFTTAHDSIMRPEELVDSATLVRLRVVLESRQAEYRRDLTRLVAKLQRRLLARMQRDWSFDLEEGTLDASRLDRLVVDPGFISAYKQEHESPFRSTVVSILIDNSGSMRGKPIEIACLASSMISEALERCGVACEILGFTTRDWKGGKSAFEWARSGRVTNPGRLNDLLHIVYKSASDPMRRSRSAICAMLDPAILKENVDGEALLWASRRLLARSESRKALIVISDGVPADQATIENNSDKTLLERHLRQVIASIENSGSIELSAIGVKHPVQRYYRNSLQIEKAEHLGASLIAMVDRLLSRQFLP